MAPQALNGRKAEAARNDARIVQAARDVFLADPEAPVSEVAATAGVGISALYRRYPSKEDLLRELARDALGRYAAELQIALDDDGDAWVAYTACLERVVDGRSQALAQRLAGRFAPTPDLSALAMEAGRLGNLLHERTQRSGGLRHDVSAADIILLLESLELIDLPGGDMAGLRRRYLALLIQSLQTSSGGALPGPAADAADLAARWRTRRTPRS